VAYLNVVSRESPGTVKSHDNRSQARTRTGYLMNPEQRRCRFDNWLGGCGSYEIGFTS